jgi:hypothetical protein
MRTIHLTILISILPAVSACVMENEASFDPEAETERTMDREAVDDAELNVDGDETGLATTTYVYRKGQGTCSVTYAESGVSGRAYLLTENRGAAAYIASHYGWRTKRIHALGAVCSSRGCTFNSGGYVGPGSTAYSPAGVYNQAWCGVMISW